MGIRLEYTEGQTFEGTRLKFVRDVESKTKHRRAMFLCDCGNEKEIQIDHVKSKRTKSCGCLNDEMTSARFKTHGQSQKPEYDIWVLMHRRVKEDPNYKDQTICERWSDVTNFIEDMGPRPDGYTLERVDNLKGYSPGNCIWADRKTQNRNTSRTINVTMDGETMCLKDWCSKINMPYKTVCARLKTGMNPVEALTKPVRR